MSRPAEQLTTSALIEDFEFLEDWSSRYGYLIELGEKRPGGAAGDQMQPILDNLPEDDRARVNQSLRQAMDGTRPFDERFRTGENRVTGCMSQVWVCALDRPGTCKIDYVGDCDTPIIKGILAVLIELMSDLTPKEIEELDLEALFDTLQLRENLSPSRHFGVYAIVELMKQQARKIGLSSDCPA